MARPWCEGQKGIQPNEYWLSSSYSKIWTILENAWNLHLSGRHLLNPDVAPITGPNSCDCTSAARWTGVRGEQCCDRVLLGTRPGTIWSKKYAGYSDQVQFSSWFWLLVYLKSRFFGQFSSFSRVFAAKDQPGTQPGTIWPADRVPCAKNQSHHWRRIGIF
jgi:hypothetical protein